MRLAHSFVSWKTDFSHFELVQYLYCYCYCSHFQVLVRTIENAADCLCILSFPSPLVQEALFEQAVRQNVYEERQNQLRWQVRLGDDQISHDDKLSVLEAREEAWNDYKVSVCQNRIRGIWA